MIQEAFVQIKLQPRASSNQIVGWKEGVLYLRLTAPPVEGAANAACIDFLAKTLGVRKSQLEIVSGHKSRDKRIHITGLSQPDTDSRLNKTKP
jgi:uncharacterized protein (TIGR00251 family)